MVQRTRMDGAYGFYFIFFSLFFFFFVFFGLIQNGRIFRVIIISTETAANLYFVGCFLLTRVSMPRTRSFFQLAAASRPRFRDDGRIGSVNGS